MGFLVGKQELKILFDHFTSEGAKAFTFLEWELEHCAAQMLEQDQQMIGVDERLFRGTLEEVFGMMGQELVQRTGGSDHHRRGGFETASGASRLLPGGSDSSGVADQDGGAQPADVDPQLEGVGGNDRFYGGVP